MDWFPPLYIVCNKRHEEERYTFLKAHLHKRGIPDTLIHWVESPWGSDLTSDTYFQHYDPFGKRFGSKGESLTFKAPSLLRGEVSLVLGFSKAIQMALETTTQHCMIFESDVVLREDFLERLEALMKQLHNQRWDYCSLGEGVGTRPIEKENSSYYSPTTLYRMSIFGSFRCTDSMLFHRNFLEKLQKTLLPFQECLDWELNIQLHLHEGISFWADPPLVEPGSGRWRNISHLPA
jgi:hypothetical protein